MVLLGDESARDLDTALLRAEDIARLIDDRYRLGPVVARGGEADVYRAVDEKLGRDVAIKIFHDGKAHQALDLHVAAKLSHPNLVALLDASEPGADVDYLVLEFVAGQTLGARIEAGPLPGGDVAIIGVQLANALAYVHDLGLVHRDVKPGNILLEGNPPDIRARLSDFGIACPVGRTAPEPSGMVVGTAPYLSPEQVRGEPLRSASDIYSLGLVLLEALTGARCYEGTGVEAAVRRLTIPPLVPTGLPEPWPQLLRSMTSDDADDRPSADNVANTLSAAATLSAPARDLHATGVIPVLPQVRSRRPRLLSAVGILVAGVLSMIGAGVVIAVSAAISHHPPPLPTSSTPVHLRSAPVRRTHVGGSAERAPNSPSARHRKAKTSAPLSRPSSTPNAPSSTSTTSTSAATSSPPAEPPSSSSAPPSSTSISAPSDSSSPAPQPPLSR